ncbi:MAG: translation initiation factor IF-2 [bacterium]
MKRLYEVAKELNISSKALMKLLNKLGHKVVSSTAFLTDGIIEECKKGMQTQKDAVKSEEKAKQTIRAHAYRPQPVITAAKKQKDKIITERRVRETITKIEMGERPKKYKAKEDISQENTIVNKIQISSNTPVKDLAQLLGENPISLITKCIAMGLLVTINQRIDFDTAATIAAEYGYEAELIPTYVEEEKKIEENIPRDPIVTIMGHVDHGKTTLLDYISHNNVAETEAGKITQHIGAYRVKIGEKHITFIDTPGHKAFTAMRVRGAKITDIVILIVAADDGVMPQTVEAINHARDANVPIIVAVNKIDLPSVIPGKVELQLLEHKIVTEKYGGENLCCYISAGTGEGVQELLEAIIVQAELLELKTTIDIPARGTIIETKLDKGKGPVATAIVTHGILKVGQPLIAGNASGKVRALYDEWGKHKSKAHPSEPVQIGGFDELPETGDTFTVVKDEKLAREISKERKTAQKDISDKSTKPVTLEQLQKDLKAGEINELKLIIKADVAGSAEAIADALEHLKEEEAKIRILHKGVGEINESDILLAATSKGIVVGFNVKENNNATQLSKEKGIEIRTYNIIYEVIEDIQLALKGLLPAKFEEVQLGRAEVKQVFKITDVGFIAGCYVLQGKIVRGAKVRVLREKNIVYEGRIESLKRIKDSVKEVETGMECGIGVNFKCAANDIIEAFEIKEIPR